MDGVLFTPIGKAEGKGSGGVSEGRGPGVSVAGGRIVHSRSGQGLWSQLLGRECAVKVGTMQAAVFPCVRKDYSTGFIELFAGFN